MSFILPAVLGVAGLLQQRSANKAANRTADAAQAASAEAQQQMRQQNYMSALMGYPAQASILGNLFGTLGMGSGQVQGVNDPALYQQFLAAASGSDPGKVSAEDAKTFAPSAQAAMNLAGSMGLLPLITGAGKGGASTMPSGTLLPGGSPPTPSPLNFPQVGGPNPLAPFPRQPELPLREGGTAANQSGRAGWGGGGGPGVWPGQQARGPVGPQVPGAAPSTRPMQVPGPSLPAIGGQKAPSMGEQFLQQGGVGARQLQQASNDYIAQQRGAIQDSFRHSVDDAKAELGAMGRGLDGAALGQMMSERARQEAAVRAQAPYEALRLQQEASNAMAGRANAAGALQGAENMTSGLGRGLVQSGQQAGIIANQNDYLRGLGGRGNIGLETAAQAAGLRSAAAGDDNELLRALTLRGNIGLEGQAQAAGLQAGIGSSQYGLAQSQAGMQQLPSQTQMQILQNLLGGQQAQAGMQALPWQLQAQISGAQAGTAGSDLERLRSLASQGQVPLEAYVQELGLRGQGAANQLGYEQAQSNRSLLPSQTQAQYLQYAQVPNQLAMSNAGTLLGLLGMASGPQTNPQDWLSFAGQQSSNAMAQSAMGQNSGLANLAGLAMRYQLGRQQQKAGQPQAGQAYPASAYLPQASMDWWG